MTDFQVNSTIEIKPASDRLLISSCRVVAVILALTVVYCVLTFPIANIYIAIALAAYSVVLWQRSNLWLMILPAMVPLIDLVPWSGRALITVFDLFIVITVAIAFWHRRFSFDFLSGKRFLLLLLIGLGLSYFSSTFLGIFNQSFDVSEPYFLFHSPLNSVRVSKGFFEAFLLLPVLGFEKRNQQPIARHFSIGMVSGLTVGILVVLWERLMFPGLFNYSSEYRISGLFSGMLIGGAAVDGFLALTFPFFVACFFAFRDRAIYVAGFLIFAGGAYSTLVTFSRSSYAAIVAILIVQFFGSFFIGKQAVTRISRKTAAFIVFGVISVMIMVPIIGGGFIQQRFSSTTDDFSTRINHWNTALGLMKASSSNYLHGLGKGTFPHQYLNETLEGNALAKFWIVDDEEANNFLRFSPSDKAGDLFVRQRFTPTGIGPYRLEISLRGYSKGAEKLLIEFCERNLLPTGRDCRWIGIKLDPNIQGRWETYKQSIDVNSNTGLLSFARPFEISLLNRGLHANLDISSVQIYDAAENELLRNITFNEQFDYWFFSSGNHLAWHIKNICVSALFEGGILELTLFLLFYGFVLFQLLQTSAAARPYAIVLLSSVAGFLVIGLFNSPFDFPKISWLFYLTAWVAILGPEDCQHISDGFIPWKKLIASVSAMGLFGGVIAFGILMARYEMNPLQLVSAVERKLKQELPWVRDMLRPPKQFADSQLDGILRQAYPRIVLPELSSWNGVGTPEFIRQRIDLHKKNGSIYMSGCGYTQLMALVSCWLETGDQEMAVKALERMTHYQVKEEDFKAQASYGGELWRVALAYDLLQPYLRLRRNDRSLIESKIKQGLRYALMHLDEDNVSLWHGRSTYASIAWICAIVLSEDDRETERLRIRAQGHFLETLKALALTEVWPEGFNYWIQNRALLITLAASAYLNGLQNTQHDDWIRYLIQRVGKWHIYATRPNNYIEGFADEGPRLDLKDETRRVIDLMVQTIQDPILAGYSKHLEKLHNYESYHRGYRWGFLLFNDPTVPVLGDGNFSSFGRFLPKAELFGKDMVNYLYIHQGWKKTDTFVSFKAGHSFTHHGHYDAGHFTLYKGAPLAINSSNYGGILAPNRLNYSIRSVAKNTLLVLKPNEEVNPNRHFTVNVSDGGQRITLPTGSNLVSVDDWERNRNTGSHLNGAELINYHTQRDQYVYISVDLTPAYNNTHYDDNGDQGKIRKVIRNLIYLLDEDHLIVYDQVTTTNASYLKKWLLHSVRKPEILGLKVLKGTANNGILESRADRATIRNGEGVLVAKRILPADAVIRAVGGKDFQYYVESDGDESSLNGHNFSEGAVENPWFDVGWWRLEIQPSKPSEYDEFLVVLSPSISTVRSDPILPLRIYSGDAVGLVTRRTSIIFNKDRNNNSIKFRLPRSSNRLVCVGLIGSQVTLSADGQERHSAIIPEAGVVNMNVDDVSGKEIDINWK